MTQSASSGYQVQRFPYAGAVDCDGHILEPPNLWEEYLESKWKPRAIRIRRDEDNLEFLEIDGKPHNALVKGIPGIVASIETDRSNAMPSPERTYAGNMPYGACDPEQRLDLLDRENLQAAALYPTLGLLWESHTEDPELAIAYARAYNRWIADFCRKSRGRLVAVAHVPLLDPEAAANEVERAVKDGCRGVFVTPRTSVWSKGTYRPQGHSAHDPVFAKCQELDVPLAIHVGNPPSWDRLWYAELHPAGGLHPKIREFDPASPAAYNFDFNCIGATHWVQRAFISFFSHGVFERFPKLRVGVLEAQAGWIGSFLDRLDGVWEHVAPVPGWGVPLKEKPSVYFRRQCFISADPDEFSTALVMDYVGPDCFMWASDYPHYDHPESWVPELKEFVDRLPQEGRKGLLGENAKRFYALD